MFIDSDEGEGLLMEWAVEIHEWLADMMTW